MAVSDPRAIAELFKKVFNLPDGVAKMDLKLRYDKVQLTVVYFVSTKQAEQLTEELKHFELSEKP